MNYEKRLLKSNKTESRPLCSIISRAAAISQWMVFCGECVQARRDVHSDIPFSWFIKVLQDAGAFRVYRQACRERAYDDEKSGAAPSTNGRKVSAKELGYWKGQWGVMRWRSKSFTGLRVLWNWEESMVVSTWTPLGHTETDHRMAPR